MPMPRDTSSLPPPGSSVKPVPHARGTRDNVILICHDCTATVPNPTGEDWLRYEPRLQSPGSGNRTA